VQYSVSVQVVVKITAAALAMLTQALHCWRQHTTVPLPWAFSQHLLLAITEGSSGHVGGLLKAPYIAVVERFFVNLHRIYLQMYCIDYTVSSPVCTLEYAPHCGSNGEISASKCFFCDTFLYV